MLHFKVWIIKTKIGYARDAVGSRDLKKFEDLQDVRKFFNKSDAEGYISFENSAGRLIGARAVCVETWVKESNVEINELPCSDLVQLKGCYEGL